MLPVGEAEDIIYNLVQPLDSKQDIEILDLREASGRILASTVESALDFPHWDNSAMDGYAVRFEDVCNSNRDRATALDIIEEIPAGRAPEKTIGTGQAARIFTGAMMPPGADTVIPQEQTQRDGDRVAIVSAPDRQGTFVRHQGEYYQSGSPLLEAGVELGAPEISVMAAAQCTEAIVYRRPRVAILSTGNELVDPGQPLKRGQIVDSNQYGLAAFLQCNGADPIVVGNVPDDPQSIQEAIAQVLPKADIILSSGGVSVGDYDYVEDILSKLNATVRVRSVAVKPGKPLTVATFPASDTITRREVLFFGLPGNPVSAMVSCWRFVQPALRKLAGLKQGWEPIFVPARSRQSFKGAGGRETYIWGRLYLVEGNYEFEPAPGSHSSGNLINLVQTNGLGKIPQGVKSVSPGETVAVLQLRHPIAE
jgi:molybdopterin molybdotransferase